MNDRLNVPERSYAVALMSKTWNISRVYANIPLYIYANNVNQG